MLLCYPDLQLDKVRLVGWGAGQAFRDYYPLLQDRIPVEYTVCPLPENHGKVINGVLVKSPQELMQEPKDEILVLIFAAHAPEIMQQIRYHYGNYRSIRALDFTSHGPDLQEVQELAPLVRAGADVRMHAEAPGYVALDLPVARPSAGDATLALKLTPSSDVALFGTVKGNVRHAYTAQPVARARIEVEGTAAPLLVDKRGAFSASLRPGSYRLTVRAPGFLPQHKNVVVSSGEGVVLNVDLEPASR